MTKTEEGKMETSNSCLVDKSCTPCKGGVPPLAANKVEKLLKELGNGWYLNDTGHLYKEYLFKDFTEAMAFANKVAKLAEKEAHHPDLKIGWGVCTIEIWTHKINGLTESDFILAANIEAIQ
jgi:4a-hydroxytetrahydrobiopterin dehydratase